MLDKRGGFLLWKINCIKSHRFKSPMRCSNSRIVWVPWHYKWTNMFIHSFFHSETSNWCSVFQEHPAVSSVPIWTTLSSLQGTKRDNCQSDRGLLSLRRCLSVPMASNTVIMTEVNSTLQVFGEFARPHMNLDARFKWLNESLCSLSQYSHALPALRSVASIVNSIGQQYREVHHLSVSAA